MPIDPRIPRINQAAARFNLSNRWIAQKLGTSHTNVNSWLDEQAPTTPRSKGVLDEILRLIESDGARERGYKVVDQWEKLIPVYASIMAGKPGSFEMDVEYEAFPVRDPSRPVWGRIVDGFSMAEIFLPGDVAVFEDRKAENGAVCHLFKDGEDVIKAWKQVGQHFQLLSFNEDYEPMDGDGWNIKGACIGRIRYGEYRIRQVTEFPSGLVWAMRHAKI
jgi:SOS-response transcriptional repressor LexA